MKKKESLLRRSLDFCIPKVLTIAKEAGLVVAAWGTKGSYLGRSDKVASLIPKLHCIRKLPSGQPEHPLYLPQTLKPVPWP